MERLPLQFEEWRQSGGPGIKDPRDFIAGQALLKLTDGRTGGKFFIVFDFDKRDRALAEFGIGLQGHDGLGHIGQT